jgi:hypothetical protein
MLTGMGTHEGQFERKGKTHPSIGQFQFEHLAVKIDHPIDVKARNAHVSNVR